MLSKYEVSLHVSNWKHKSMIDLHSALHLYMSSGQAGTDTVLHDNHTIKCK